MAIFANEIIGNDNDFDFLAWLDYSPKGYDAWGIIEEASRLQSIEAAQKEKYPGFENLFMAGRIYGMACALAAMTENEMSVDEWLGFIEGFAESNYEGGERLE